DPGPTALRRRPSRSRRAERRAPQTAAGSRQPAGPTLGSLPPLLAAPTRPSRYSLRRPQPQRVPSHFVGIVRLRHDHILTVRWRYEDHSGVRGVAVVV